MLNSKIATESDFHEPWFKDWSATIGCDPVVIHRKTWEYVMLAQALGERGMLQPGKRGIGFAVGKEPLPATFASKGCDILATDLDPESESGRLWGEGNDVIANGCSDLYRANLLSLNDFNARVSYRSVDMTAIPQSLRNGEFDFSWSNCSFEHLGSIRHGMDFIINQIQCLKPGGISAHTTEYNCSSNSVTLNESNIALFRRRDIEQLISELQAMSCEVAELDTSMGFTEADYFVDKFPYKHNPHLRLGVNEWVSTSILLVVRKGL